jgi:hypothetical protein
VKPYRIVPVNGWLFFSSKLWPERDLPALRARGIAAVVNLCEHHRYTAPRGTALLEAGFPDGTGVSCERLASIYAFLDRHRPAGAVLVHCSAGVSRSAGLAVGQLLLDHPEWSWDEALAAVHARRSVWVGVELRESVRAYLAARARPAADPGLEPGEAGALAALDRAWGAPLPRLAALGWNARGYVAEHGRITGVGLCGLGLSSVPRALYRLRRLRELALADNSLRVLPPELGELAGLERLELSGNRFTDLPAELARLSGLRSLNASRNAIEQLPADLGALERLEELYLHRNRLGRFPEEFGRLGALRELYLQENALRELPASIGQLSSLERLSATRNALVELPDAIGDAARLAALGLGRNQLRRLPESLGRLPALDNLNVSSNALTELPAALTGLRRLRRINLALNEFKELSPEHERWLAGLEAAGGDVIREGWSAAGLMIEHA